MKKFERIFLYSMLAILFFYVFLVDGNVESQVVIQEEIRAKSISIMDNAGQEVVRLWANKNGGIVSVFKNTGTYVAGMGATDTGGLISVRNKDGTFVAGVSTTEDGGGMVGVSNKAGAPGAFIAIYKDDGLIEVYNKQGDVIGSLP